MIALPFSWRSAAWIVAALALAGLVAALAHYRSALHDERNLRTAERASYLAAQAEADRIARAALSHQEAVYRAKAQDADHAHALKLADARSAADRYIAAHRVHSPAQGPAGSTIASAAPDSSGLPARAPADGVVVAEADVHACTEAVIYARQAHDWAASLSGGD